MLEKFYTLAHRIPLARLLLGALWRTGKDVLWSFRGIVKGGAPISVRVGHGASIKIEPTGQIAKMLWTRRFEIDLRDFIVRHCKPGMLFINIGANAGLYTLMASKLVGPSGRVHAFEPSTDN